MRRRQMRRHRRISRVIGTNNVDNSNVKPKKTERSKKSKGQKREKRQQELTFFESPVGGQEEELYDLVNDSSDRDDSQFQNFMCDYALGGNCSNTDVFSMGGAPTSNSCTGTGFGPLHLQGPLEKINEDSCNDGSISNEDDCADDEHQPEGEDTSASSSTYHSSREMMDWDCGRKFLGGYSRDDGGRRSPSTDSQGDGVRRFRKSFSEESSKLKLKRSSTFSSTATTRSGSTSSSPILSNVAPPPPPSSSKYELTPTRTKRKPLGDLMHSGGAVTDGTNNNINVGSPTSSARKAQKWEQVINQAWDKNGLTSPLRNQKTKQLEAAERERVEEEERTETRVKSDPGNQTSDSSFDTKRNENISGYMQFDADASQFVRKIPVKNVSSVAAASDSPSSASTSTSAWIDQLSSVLSLSTPKTATSNSIQQTPVSNDDSDPTNVSRESLPSTVKPNLYVSDSRVEVSMGESLGVGITRIQSNDVSNLDNSITPAQSDMITRTVNNTVTSLISAAKSSFNSTQDAGVHLEDFFEDFAHAGDQQTQRNVQGMRPSLTVKTDFDYISESSLKFREFHPNRVVNNEQNESAYHKLFSGSKSKANKTEETELCADDVFSQSFIQTTELTTHHHDRPRTPFDGYNTSSGMTSRLNRYSSPYMETYNAECFIIQEPAADHSTFMTPVSGMSCFDSTLEVEHCVADVFEQSLANDSTMQKKRFVRPSSAGKSSLDTTSELEHCVADVFDQSLANESAVLRKPNMRSAVKSSFNTTSEVAHCVADMFDQTFADDRLKRKVASRPRLRSERSLNSTSEVEECVADILDQSLATDSIMKKLEKKRRSSDAMSTANSTMEIAECVADIMEQTLASDGVMTTYQKNIFSGDMHSRNIEESSSTSTERKKEIETLSKQASQHVAEGEYDEAILALEKVLNIHIADHGEKHPIVASDHHNIGIVHSKNVINAPSKTDANESISCALKSFRTAAKIARKTVGKNHPNVAVSLARIGLIYLQTNKCEEADLIFEECLRIRKIAFGKNHPLVAKVYNNLGIAKLRTENLEGALLAFQCAGVIQKRCLKEMAPVERGELHKLQLELADTLCNVGTVCLDLMERGEANIDTLKLSKQAIDVFDEVLHIRSEVLGGSHVTVQETKVLHKDAKKLHLSFLQADEDDMRSIGDEVDNRSISNSESIQSKQNYAQTDTHNDEDSNIISNVGLDDDLSNSEDSIATTQSKLVTDIVNDQESCRISNIGNNNDLGLPSEWTQSPAEVEFSFQESRTNSIEPVGKGKVTELNVLAEQALKDGDFEKSLFLFEDVLAQFKSAHGELHHLVGSTLHNIGTVLLRLNQNEKALHSFERAVRIRRGAIGRDHPDVAVSLVKVGISQLLLKRFDDALGTFREALSVRRHALGHLHPSTARIYNNIGCVHVEFNELKEARRAFESALDVQRNALCYKPEDTKLLLGASTTLCNLAYLYTYRRAYTQASLVLEEALILQERVYDVTHPTVLSILDSLADSYGKGGDNANAVMKYKEAIMRLNFKHDNKENVGIDDVNDKDESSGDTGKEGRTSLIEPQLSTRKRKALAILKYKLSKVYRNQNDYECALKSLHECLAILDNSDVDIPTSELIRTVKDEKLEVEKQMKTTDLNWL